MLKYGILNSAIRGSDMFRLRGISQLRISEHAYFIRIYHRMEFQCSHKTLQQIYDAALWSVKTNFHHIPTDCPHREKNGWTGDAHISSEFALFNLNMEEAYIQYIDNLVDCQWPSGQLPCIAPTSVYGYNYQSGPTLGVQH